MLNLYTTKIGEYYTTKLSDKGNSIIKTPYSVDIKERECKELDDFMYDYLLSLDSEFINFTNDEIESLKNAGYDINPDNWAIVTCPYLPFIHYLYLPESWMI